ncbi:MAG: hypothetical protein COB85_03535 [Bacteroidetes bacterium]|nr:MAG: hypothetical protein COB85_03535 [Bacteroidota bacterium]
MRKFSNILLVVFYLLVSVGIGYNMHYCGGNLSSIDLYAKSSACCCDEDMANNCCDDESSYFQFTSDQKLADRANISITEVNLFADLYIEINNAVDISRNLVSTAYLDLPPPDPERIYLLNCSFVFYG